MSSIKGMRFFCQKCGEMVAVNGFGRPRLDVAVNKVCDALRVYSSVTLAAQELGCSRGFIYKVCKTQGKMPRDYML